MGNKGYALRNLNYQIQLQYGGTFRAYDPKYYGEGTTAVIRLENISEVEKGVVILRLLIAEDELWLRKKAGIDNRLVIIWDFRSL